MKGELPQIMLQNLIWMHLYNCNAVENQKPSLLIHNSDDISNFYYHWHHTHSELKINILSSRVQNNELNDNKNL